MFDPNSKSLSDGLRLSSEDGRMPPCANCGHGWAFHIIPDGVESLDIYPTERWCVDGDCRCRNYIKA